MDLQGWLQEHEKQKQAFDKKFEELFSLSQKIYDKWSQE
jgi:hypothetical protein